VAKSGIPSKLVHKGGQRSASTRRALVAAAIETLKTEGFAGASARVIADRAQSNQGLIFYHFGSVADLLLAALDEVSAERMERYSAVVAGADTPSRLVDAATDIFRQDLDAGYITVLVEMIAGASSVPDLGAEVSARIEPWRQFAETAIESALDNSALHTLLPAQDVAQAVVALYLGLEMLSHLEGRKQPALDLFAHAKRFARLFETTTQSATSKETT
jgi:AcrR family transcriptional regulator